MKGDHVWQRAMTVAGLIVIWELMVDAGAGNRALLPPPSAIFSAFLAMAATGEIWQPIAITLRRLLAGFVICTVAGVTLGIITANVAVLDEALEPFLELIRSLPKAALVPPLVLLVGIGDAANIICVVLAGLFPVWINVVRGVRHIDPILLQSARTLALSRAGTLRKVILPAILPDAFAGARVALGLCFVVVVIAEMTMGSDGLGSLIVDAQRSFRVRQMYAWVFILAALGVCINALVVSVERRVVFWADRRI